MADEDAGRGWQWDIHTSVVHQLGEQLVSDEVQALVELIKNAYDADAEWAEVTIETRDTSKAVGSRYRQDLRLVFAKSIPWVDPAVGRRWTAWGWGGIDLDAKDATAAGA